MGIFLSNINSIINLDVVTKTVDRKQGINKYCGPNTEGRCVLACSLLQNYTRTIQPTVHGSLKVAIFSYLVTYKYQLLYYLN